MDVPAAYRQRLAQFERSAATADRDLFTKYEELRKLFLQRKYHVFSFLGDDTRRLVVTAYCTFGPTSQAFVRLSQSPWNLTLDSFLLEFDYKNALSKDFCNRLADLATSEKQISYDVFMTALRQAQKQRDDNPRAGVPRVASQRWINQDISNAVDILGATVKANPTAGLNDDAAATATFQNFSGTESEHVRAFRTASVEPGAPSRARASKRAREASPIAPTTHRITRSASESYNKRPRVQSPAISEQSVERGRATAHGDFSDSFDLDDFAVPSDDEDDPSFVLQPYGDGHSPTPLQRASPKSPQNKPTDAHVPTPEPSDRAPCSPLHALVPTPEPSDLASRTPPQKDADAHVTCNVALSAQQSEEVRRIQRELKPSMWLSHAAIFHILPMFRPSHVRILEIPEHRGQWRDWVPPAKYKVSAHENAVLVPLHLSERRHWVLYHLDLLNNRTTYTDSILTPHYTDSDRSDDVAAALQRSIIRTSSNSAPWTHTFRTNAAQQTGCDDCGVFVLANCLYLMAGLELPTHMHANLWRSHFSVAIDPSIAASDIIQDLILRDSASPPVLSASHPLIMRHETNRRLLQTLHNLKDAMDENHRVFSALLAKVPSVEDLRQRAKDDEQAANLLADSPFAGAEIKAGVAAAAERAKAAHEACTRDRGSEQQRHTITHLIKFIEQLRSDIQSRCTDAYRQKDSTIAEFNLLARYRELQLGCADW